MERKEAIEVIKKNWPNSSFTMLREALETVIPELKESDDDRIWKEIIEHIKIQQRVIKDEGHIQQANDIEKWLALLKKQGEQKPNKVKPKFKVGDWVVYERSGNTYQIHSIDNHDSNYIVYACEPLLSNNDDIPCFCEEMIHLWTIQDAKVGDVLSFNDGHGNDSIELIKSITDKKIEFWFCLTNGSYYELFDGITPYTNFASREKARPATKEQCDLLFTKMKESGYEWDAEKKEMRKIDQKPAWSEEDEETLNNILNDLSQNVIPDDEDTQWLKSLKERMKK